MGYYLEGQGHSKTLQQNHVRPITLLFEVGFYNYFWQTTSLCPIPFPGPLPGSTGSCLLQEWASDDSPMGVFVYHTYSAADFDVFFNATRPYSDEFFLGIGKPNMSKNADPVSKYWPTQMNSLKVSDGRRNCFFCCVLKFVKLKSMFV